MLKSSDPADGAFQIPLNQTVTIEFSSAFDPATVDVRTLSLESEDGTSIAGSTTIVQNGLNRTLRFTTIQFLVAGKRHECRVDPDLRSAQGEPFVRMVVILSVVAAITLCSALLFQSLTLKRIYKLR